MKKTSLLLYLAFSFCGSISFAQQALTPEVLQTLKESYSHDDAHKAIRNAVMPTPSKSSRPTVNRRLRPTRGSATR